MPLTGDRKREYNKLRQRRRRLVAREREYEGEGGQQKGQHYKREVVPDTTQLEGGTTPFEGGTTLSHDRWYPNPFAKKAAKWALDYMVYINARGYTVDRETGELLDLLPGYTRRIEALEGALFATQQALAALQVEVSMLRAAAILDDHLRELKEGDVDDAEPYR